MARPSVVARYTIRAFYLMVSPVVVSNLSYAKVAGLSSTEQGHLSQCSL